MTFKIQAQRCSTCIYRKDSILDLSSLEHAVSDPKLKGFFKGYRICHHSKKLCCRGFWDKHKNDFTLGQIAQRLGVVEFVSEDLTE